MSLVFCPQSARMQFTEANTPSLKRQHSFLSSDVSESVSSHENAGAVIFQLQSKNLREAVQMPHAESFQDGHKRTPQPLKR